MKNKSQILFFIFIVLLFSCQTTEKKGKDEKGALPKVVEELVVPSGFDSDFVLGIKNKKKMKFVKPVLRVMRFDIPDTFLKAINDYEFKMDEKVKAELANTGRFTMLGSDSDIKAVLEEQMKLGYDEFSEGDATIEMGNLRIAGYTVVGKITQSYPIVTQMGGYFSLKVAVEVSLTVTNANTGVIEFTNIIKTEKEENLFVSAEGMIIQGPRNLTSKPINAIGATGKDVDLSPQYRSALDKATMQVINYIEEKIPIMGEVIGMNDDELMTTASEAHGIKKGDYLFILRIGEPLMDSSGAVLGFNKKTVGAAQVVTVEKGMSASEIVKLKNEDILPERGDIIISLPAHSAQ